MLDPGFHVGLIVTSMLDSRSPQCWTTDRCHLGLPIAALLGYRLPYCALASMLGANGHLDVTISTPLFLSV